MCLPSASLNEHGKLILDALDLNNSSVVCIHGCISRLYRQAHGLRQDHRAGTFAGPSEPYPSFNIAIPTDSANSLAPPTRMAYDALNLVLRGSDANISRALIGQLIDMGALELYVTYQLRFPIDARLGDFGYIDRSADVETFVRLGDWNSLGIPLKPIVNTSFASHGQSPLSQWNTEVIRCALKDT